MATDWQLKRAFPQKTLRAITHQIKISEEKHHGEIRFVIEPGLSGVPLYSDQSARERAIDVFALLRMWDTDQRNGVLIYVLLADHSVEIVADRGIHRMVGENTWQKICHDIETAFNHGQYEQGVIKGIDTVSELLEKTFPATTSNRNELPDQVILL
jgi:uncharacterized membrane protein